MNKKIMKSIVMVFTLIAVLLVLTTISNAASISITTSKSSVSPGEVFTATITLSGGAGPVTASVQNGSGSATQFLDNGSMNVSCTAGSSGTVTISASGTVGDYATETDVNVSSSKSVTIVVPESEQTTPKQTQTNPTVPSKQTTPTKPAQTPTKSSNALLSKLEIAEGTIEPEFKWSIKEYTISVPNEVTKLSIAATADHERATVEIKGNEELQVGENEIEIIVTAEDGTKGTYTIKVTRELPELNLQGLNLYYLNEDGERIELKLSPVFLSNIYEYNILEELPYTVKNLIIETTVTREDAIIEILGNEELAEGTNEITIMLTLSQEEESALVEEVEETSEEEIIEEEETIQEKVEEESEQRIYKITVEREKEPEVIALTTGGKIKTFFSSFGTKVGKWYTDNYDRIISGMILFATVIVIGLTIYFVYDYKNYKKIVAKLAELNKANLMEKANVALNVEQQNIKDSAEENSEEVEEAEETTEEDAEEVKVHRSARRERRGRRFRR